MDPGVHSGQGEYYGAMGGPAAGGIAGGESIPPAHIAGAQGHGSGHSMTGKVESAVGGLIGSKALKAKGQQKEQ